MMDYDPMEVRRMARENWSPSGSPRTKENLVNGRDKLRGVRFLVGKADVAINVNMTEDAMGNLMASLPLIDDLDQNYLIFERGPVDWIWDEDLEMHIPCCTEVVERTYVMAGEPIPIHAHCGNGPLVGEQLRTGKCGEH